MTKPRTLYDYSQEEQNSMPYDQLLLFIGESRVRRATGGGHQLEMNGCTWKSAAAINQIAIGLWANGTNFVAGTRATLYGMG